MNIVAAITTGEGAIIGTLVLGLTALFGLLSKYQAQQDRTVQAAVTATMAEIARQNKAQSSHVAPQPFVVQAATKSTSRESFERHAMINREEHSRIEREFGETIQRIATDIHNLSREMSALTASRLSDTNALSHLQAEFEKVRDTVNRMAGKLGTKGGA